MQDLITLAQAGAYLSLTPTQYTADVMLPSMIDGASQFFLSLTSLPYIALTSFTERRNGTNTATITTKNRPLQTISSLVISNFNVPVSPDGVQPGYYFNPGESVIYLVGGYNWQNRYFAAIGFGGYPGKFIKGYGNVFITGTAGYPNNQVSGEVHTVPASPFNVTLQNASTFVGASTLTVTYQNTGLPLMQVTGTPTVGQYVIASNGVMTFAAADVGAVVLSSYQTIGIPLDIQQCVYEMVAWAYKERDRIGKTTVRFADNLSESYARTPFSERAKLTIQRYTRKDAVGW